LGQAGDGGAAQFRQEIGLNELEEALDFAAPFGVIGGAQDAFDAQGGTEGIELFGGVDLGPIDIDGQGQAVAEDIPTNKLPL